MKKMRIALVIMLAAASSITHAATFEERVRLGKEAERKYGLAPRMIEATVDQLADHMRVCITASPNHQVKSLVLVADFTQAGRAINVEVKPAVGLTICFAEKFRGIQFPKLPRELGQGPLPFSHEFRN